MDQTEKVAIITGASQGIGAGLVRAYREYGYAVVANSRSIQQGADDRIVSVPGSIDNRGVAASIVATAMQRFGRIDTLVNNAGIFISKPFTEYTDDDFRAAFAVNIAGFFHITQLAIPQMLKQQRGHIVQMTTSLVDQPLSNVPAALASLTKGGLAAVTRGLAMEYAARGIRVNAVSPGVVKTPMHSPDTYDSLSKLHPVGRMAEIDDIVDAVLYLEHAGFVTGETLHVDGGQNAGRW
ncbi:SDR family NAD(P)-dependent oxidoreductase [Tardiphaga robiniae]|uniref:SDR family oxidoreductase n=1 Tax=Tardiphaga robiniae TaxID=943830 RepID=A0A7G6TU20_9BRAD|nr:SDR family oxidoreductase [Tardiphaga robiniae]QND70252.1 SDR family oxidoreductase [Tardiphaga robiniae]